MVDISDCMGWDLGLVKREFKSFFWNVISYGNDLESCMIWLILKV